MSCDGIGAPEKVVDSDVNEDDANNYKGKNSAFISIGDNIYESYTSNI